MPNFVYNVSLKILLHNKNKCELYGTVPTLSSTLYWKGKHHWIAGTHCSPVLMDWIQPNKKMCIFMLWSYWIQTTQTGDQLYSDTSLLWWVFSGWTFSFIEADQFEFSNCSSTQQQSAKIQSPVSVAIHPHLVLPRLKLPKDSRQFHSSTITITDLKTSLRDSKSGFGHVLLSPEKASSKSRPKGPKSRTGKHVHFVEIASPTKSKRKDRKISVEKTFAFEPHDDIVSSAKNDASCYEESIVSVSSACSLDSTQSRWTFIINWTLWVNAKLGRFITCLLRKGSQKQKYFFHWTMITRVNITISMVNTDSLWILEWKLLKLC